MKTLVTGGTGTVGSQVVQYLLQENKQVRVLTTSPENAIRLPKSVEAVIGDLDKPETLDQAFEGIDNVFLLNAQSHTEIQQGIHAVAAAKKAGVRKIVYQSIHQVRQAPHVPHFYTKIAIEEAVINSGLSYTFVSPNNFYQNDFWLVEAIAGYNLYPQPIGHIGLNRVDVRDIAEIAVKALYSDELNGKTIALVGPDILNGATTAHLLTEILNYPVAYAGNDLVSWAAQAKLILPAWKVDDWVEMYQFFQKQGLIASENELSELTQLLGRPPRSYADFIKEHKSTFLRKPVEA
ncbi:NmrA family NAD(P)-binding protein [Rhodocytophaga rosea]|uniref:NmrA family NAD(P)-binding protein n=1 Tax=Rhodocytophaga rosea TaxID=2704465 RepID=A0A6C0GKS9_9BACT|nr:NmrA family NAD(P)-binding protein [Rhodocytophaga rosea]QHT68646.1 NmrA family NAD(P)-binding protein [Rhodocytophaga rosea]